MEAQIFNVQKFSLHDGAGIRTNVFFQGCNLRCKWCSNPESQDMHPERPDSDAKPYTLAALMAELLKDKPFYDASGGGVTLTGGEALLQPTFACALCDALHAAGVGTAMETSAHVPTGIFQKVLRKCDIMHIDLKHYDHKAHMLGTGVGNEQIVSNIRLALQSGMRTIIRIPVVPGFNDAPEDIPGFAALLEQLGAREIQLLPFHQMGESKYEQMALDYAYAGAAQLHDQDVEPLAQALTAIGANVQIGV